MLTDIQKRVSGVCHKRVDEVVRGECYEAMQPYWLEV
jgi:hypothetical protein